MERQLLPEKYLMEELNITGDMLFIMMERISKYDDIYDEFCYWLKNRNYDKENPLTINGYTAKQIHELNPKFEGIGVYDFMITLREKPEFAEECIQSGFVEL